MGYCRLILFGGFTILNPGFDIIEGLDHGTLVFDDVAVFVDEVVVAIELHSLLSEALLNQRDQIREVLHIRNAIARAGDMHVARLPEPIATAHDDLAAPRPESQLEHSHGALGFCVKEEAYNGDIFERRELPFDLASEGFVFFGWVDTRIPGSASGVAHGNGQFLEVLFHALLPLNGVSHFDTPGEENGVFAISRNVRRHAEHKVFVSIEPRRGCRG